MLPAAYVVGSAICLNAVICCLLTGIILFLFSTSNRPSRFLGFYYLAFAYAFLVAGLTYSHLISQFPHLYRTGNFCWLMVMPLSWLYIRSTVTHKYLSGWDVLHLLPVVLYLVDYFPFFITPGEGKTAVIRSDLGNLDKLLHYREGWLLPSNMQIPMRVLQAAFYWTLQIRLLTSWRASALRKDALHLKWLMLFNALQILLFLPGLIVLISGAQNWFWVSTIPPVTGTLLSCLTLFMYPRLLYNLKFADPAFTGKPKPVLDPAYIIRLTQQLELFMREERPFLNPDYTLRELAEAIGTPLYKMSAYLNQATGTHFSDYLNQWRIRYCLDLIHEKKVGNLNLNGVATKCGFNNRNTFSNAFKKVTGKAPSVYLHSIN